MSDNYERVKEHILDNLDSNGNFKQTYKEIGDKLGINQNIVRMVMLKIVKEGMLVTISPPKKGCLSNPLYRIKGVNNLTKPTASSITETSQLSKPNCSYIEQDVEFEGVHIKLVTNSCNNGSYISLNDLSVATVTDSTLYDKIISANVELFAGEIETVNDNKYLSKVAVIHLLSKLNLSNVINQKREALIKFNKNIVNMMRDYHLSGKIVITHDNKVRLVTNISELTDIHMEDVIRLISEYEGQINGMYTNWLVTTQKGNQVNKKLTDENKMLSGRVETINRAKEALITENRELKGKLLER